MASARSLTVAALAFAAACSGDGRPASSEITVGDAPGTAPAAATSSATGWVSSGVSEAMFVTVTIVGDRLDGVIELATLDDAGVAVNSRTLPVTATVSIDGGVTTFIVETESGVVWPGRIEGGVLTLSVRGGDGLIRDIEMRAGSATDFNAGVEILHATADANRRSAEEQAEAADAEAEAQAAQEAVERQRTARLRALAADADDLRATLDLTVLWDGVTVAEQWLTDIINGTPGYECFDAGVGISDINLAVNDVSLVLDDVVRTLDTLDADSAALRDLAIDIDESPTPGVVTGAIHAADAADGVAAESRARVAAARESAAERGFDAIVTLAERCDYPLGE